jgi:hypothetical protein
METTEFDSVMNLFNYYKEEAHVDPDRFSENRLIETLRQYNIRPNLFFRVAYNGLRPVGMIGGFLSEDPVEDQITATIQFNYLLPEFAQEENYALMIEQFQTWGSQFGAEQLRAIDIGNNINRLKKIYDALDFDPIGVTIMNREIA